MSVLSVNEGPGFVARNANDRFLVITMARSGTGGIWTPVSSKRPLSSGFLESTCPVHGVKSASVPRGGAT